MRMYYNGDPTNNIAETFGISIAEIERIVAEDKKDKAESADHMIALERGELCQYNEPGCDCNETTLEYMYEDQEDDFLTGDTKELPAPPEAPEGYEWVLLPARPGGAPAPGETGHYSDLNPEPIQVSEAWGLDGLEHSALKYLARYRKKAGILDLEKVKFYADRIIAREKREGRG